jgi:hypothetical protein
MSDSIVEPIKRLVRSSLNVAWAGVILLLPITSLPLLSRLAGNTMVAPASFLPLGWLVLWFIYYIFRKGTLPREVVPLLLFVSMAVISSAYAIYLNIPSFKGGIIINEEFKAILTLMIGLAFYFIASSWLFASPNLLTFTLKLINISGLIMLTWAIVQAIYIFFYHGEYPEILNKFQMLFSTRELFKNRMTGFAFEPSWMAQQLNLFFLPFWLAASITRSSAFRWRILRLSLENILLLIGIIVLFLSSRVGTLAFLLILAFLGVYFNFITAKHLQQWAIERFASFHPFWKKILPRIAPFIIMVLFLGLYALGGIALVFVLSHVDLRLARFFQIYSIAQLKEFTSNIYFFFNYLSFAERYVYWVGGWNVFNIHPILGVGLGNAGFYFHETLPAYSWNLPEVMDVLYRSTIIPNIKSLWVRLLAETGIVGFSSFMVWCYVQFRSGWTLKNNKTQLNKTIGWFGIFVLVAFVIEGFSTDTFALPYLWISMGIVCAGAANSRRTAGGTIHSRAAKLVAKLEKGQQKTSEIFKLLTLDQWNKPLYHHPTWQARHLLAHFVSAEKQLLSLAQSVSRGGEGTPLEFDIDRFNANEQSRLEGQSVTLLLDLLYLERQRTIEWVRTLGDDELEKIGRHPALGDVNVETMIGAIYGHQLIHMRDLSKLLVSVV